MNQPFEKVTYDVVALNANKEDVKNYAHFAPSLQQHFYLGELGGYQDRFVPPAPQRQNGNASAMPVSVSLSLKSIYKCNVSQQPVLGERYN